MPSLAQVRPVDPVLNNFSLSYRNDQVVYAQDIFMPFTPSDDGGDTGTYMIDDPLNNLRARDVNFSFSEGAHRGSSRFTKGTWSAEPYAWEEAVPDAFVRNWQGGSNRQSLKEKAARSCVDIIMLAREVRVEAIADAVAPTVSLAGTAKWGSTAANPRSDIKTGSAAILKKTAATANGIILTGSVSDSITGSQSTGSAGDLFARAMGYNNRVMAGDVNEDNLRQYFGVDVVKMARGIQSDATKYVNTTIPGAAGLAEAGTYIWDQDEAYIFRFEQGEAVVSFGQTFGSTLGIADQYREDKTTSDVVRYQQFVVEKTTCSGALYVLGTIL